MGPLHPGFDNQHKLVFILFIIGCLMSVTYNGLDHWSTGHLYIFGKHGFSRFTSKGLL